MIQVTMAEWKKISKDYKGVNNGDGYVNAFWDVSQRMVAPEWPQKELTLR